MANDNQNKQQDSNAENANPQQGDKWNNYQTKELAGEGNAETAEEAAEVFEKEEK